MSDTVRMPADGGGTGEGRPDGVNDTGQRGQGGESGGAGYANPHGGKDGDESGFMGHGGQAEIAYSGTGQGGHDDDPEVGNENAVTKD